MARTLRTMASGKRTGDKQRRVPHALPAGRLQQGRGQGQLHRIPRQSVLPQAYQAGGDPQARATARNAQADQRRRPVRTASEICAGARPLHVQLLHPRHVVRGHDLSAKKRHQRRCADIQTKENRPDTHAAHRTAPAAHHRPLQRRFTLYTARARPRRQLPRLPSAAARTEQIHPEDRHDAGNFRTADILCGTPFMGTDAMALNAATR